ncbi:hypothetical protein, partial [Enterobacter roggenkampii]|uniref:hypothetical protein n=1 Tax=Enterobacter roggenkampii TaxID=1812935 RepID=UPI001EEB8C24
RQNLPEVIKKVRISDLAWYGYWGGISHSFFISLLNYTYLCMSCSHIPIGNGFYPAACLSWPAQHH